MPVEFLHELRSGFRALPARESFSAICLAAVDRFEGRLVIIPDRVAHPRLLLNHYTEFKTRRQHLAVLQDPLLRRGDSHRSGQTSSTA